ncbi:MAG TPA: glutamine-hydrolyzing carbamoyl-phosphate synthase small subunit [Thermoanaerobaculia bacterium]|nr:glutamine-hydrolyzing carbamoyl-phosphate synthase small subunit [Thermoanaerobaculia bacterium]
MTTFPSTDGILLLEDGAWFAGRLAAAGRRFGEVVFNTSMTGYQEVLTDPSYRGQIVVMTQPHIGNYGLLEAAEESRRPWVEGFVAREFTAVPSGLGRGSLIEYLASWDIPALDGIDTRALVRRLRDRGSMRGVIAPASEDREALARELAAFPTMEGRALVDEVTCAETWEVPAEGETRFRLAVYDFGVKSNILRSLSRLGAHLHVLPARTPADECLALGVDGVVLSNGPGDPEPLVEIVANVRRLIDAGVPILGICLGHQLLGLALGGRTFKLKFGHHGGNQPVRDEQTGGVAITSQNHGFAIDMASLPPECRVTGINLNDGTMEAFAVAGKPIYSVQYHPEAAPGPHDAARLFGEFLDAVAAVPGAVRAPSPG